uniref:UvrD-helicase domain-containing protein n=1 Tax=Prevotellamassilia timonensis TaxID=1852370 RepID=UPI00402A3FF1
AAGSMDFDDLLLNMFLLLRDHPDVRERYINRFRYILVDEYQDTNMAQHKILTLLTTPQSKICVVGDDAQSIYGFRGADITNILTFKEQYPSAKLIKLECNYRSTRNIVEAANCIISNNHIQIPTTVFLLAKKVILSNYFLPRPTRKKPARCCRTLSNYADKQTYHITR